MGPRILLLEDDVPLACEIKAALVEIGCAVEIVRDGNAGLARAVSDRFDLVVASLELPGMNGFRLCNRLKKEPQGRTVPIFLLTAQTASDVFEEHRKLATRADSYFHKPLTMAEIVARVRASVVDDDLVITDVEEPSAAGAEDSHVDSRAVDLLRSRIREHEETNLRLLRELAESRARAEKLGDALGHSARELEKWKSRAHSIAAASTDASSEAREQIVHREQIVAKDTQIARLRKELDAAAHAAAELRRNAQLLEGERPALEQRIEEQARHAANLEKLLSAAREDKEQAARRGVDLARRLERARPDLERMELALTREKEGRKADAAAHALSLAELALRKDSEWAEAERKRNEEAAAVDAARADSTAKERTEHDVEVARLREGVAALRLTHTEQLAELTRAHEAELALAKQSSDDALEAMRERARTEASAKVRAELEIEFGQAMDDLRGDLEVERAHVFGQMERAHATAMRRTVENGERERSLMGARLAEREKSLADAEDALERERRGDVARVTEMAARFEALEALAASRIADKERVERERDEARSELPALEAEIAALRTELTSMRLQLDDQIILARASAAELSESRRRQAKTEAALAEARARAVALETRNAERPST